MPITAAQPIADSSLFKLPPELRNRIYELALHTGPTHLPDSGMLVPGFLTISQETGIPEPSLLASCKTVRREGIGIFYSPDQHVLEQHIDSFHPAMPILWKRKSEALFEQYGLEEIPVWWRNQGSRDWRNLLLWLQKAHQDQVIWAQSGLEDGMDLDVGLGLEEARLVRIMFDMVEMMKQQPWSAVKRLLDDFLGVLPIGWAPARNRYIVPRNRL